ncbi:MAG: FecR domain-containing protein [Bacteroidota bacterium]|nr:FecR domain-containing protein [Bacteroidota bacterium]
MSEKETEYLISYLLGELSPEEALAVEKVLASDSELNAEFASMRKAWEKSGMIYDVQNIDVTNEWQKFKLLTKGLRHQTVSMKKRSYLLNPRLLVAASLFIVLSIGIIIHFLTNATNKTHSSDAKINYAHVIVPRGQKQQVTLPDGTKVWLNAESKLSWPQKFEANERNVKLEGEGYFEVAHDKSKPFHVITKGIKVEVLGTVFNISAYPDDQNIETALLSGSVSLTEMKSGGKTLLAPFEVASFNRKSRNIVKSKFRADTYSLWKEGEFIFFNEQPEIVFKKLERYFDKEFVYNSNLIKNKRLTAHFRKHESLGKILQVTGEALDLKFKVNDKKIRVTEFKRPPQLPDIPSEEK